MTSARYWAPAKSRLHIRTIEDLHVVFDPISSTSHFLTPIHSAVLDFAPSQHHARLPMSDLIALLGDQFEFEADFDVTSAVASALDHLLGACLLEKHEGA